MVEQEGSFAAFANGYHAFVKDTVVHNLSPDNEAMMDPDGGWLDSDADILLDEQVRAFGRADLDLAKQPLFYRVNEDKLSSVATYQSLIALYY